MAYKDAEKQRSYQREWAQRKKNSPSVKKLADRKASIRRFIQSVKVTEGCIRCGYREHPAALDFHHRDEKNFGVSDLGHRNWSSIIDEILKCDVLCANCHRIKTHTIC